MVVDFTLFRLISLMQVDIYLSLTHQLDGGDIYLVLAHQFDGGSYLLCFDS